MNGRFNALSCERSVLPASSCAWSRRVAIAVSWVAVVDGQVRLGDIELEQIGSARELQDSGFGADAPACGPDVGGGGGAGGVWWRGPCTRARDRGGRCGAPTEERGGPRNDRSGGGGCRGECARWLLCPPGPRPPAASPRSRPARARPAGSS